MKKLLSLILVAVMLLGCLAGCGKTEEKSSEQPSSQQSSAAESKESEAVEPSKEEPKPDPVTVKAILSLGTQEDTKAVVENVNKILLEKYNVLLDLETIPAGELQSRCELAIAANESFDIFWTSNWSNKWTSYINKDSLLPLDDLLAEYGQGILEVAANYLPALKRNGITYAVPCLQNNVEQSAMFIQKEIFDKYGQLTVEKIQEAFKADSTGKALNELMTPFYNWCKVYYPDLYMFDPEGVYAFPQFKTPVTQSYVKLNNYLYVMDDYKVVAYNQQPMATILKEQYEWGRECHANGYVQPDVATTTDAATMLAANKYIITVGNYQIGIEATLKNSKGIDWVAIPLKEATTIYNGPQNTALAIPITSKNPEAAMTLMNALWTDAEVFNALSYGIEGKHYKKVSENKVEMIADSGWSVAGSNWKLGNTFLGWVNGDQDETTPQKQMELNATATPHFLDGFSFTTKNVKDAHSQCNAIFGEYNAMKWSDDYDELAKERDAKLEKAGIQSIVEDAQRQVDEWRALVGK